MYCTYSNEISTVEDLTLVTVFILMATSQSAFGFPMVKSHITLEPLTKK